MRVIDLPRKQSTSDGNVKPSHWANSNGSAFHNPWPSWRTHGAKDFLTLMVQLRHLPSVSKDKSQLIPIRTPTWGIGHDARDKIKSTWLGHACFLVEMPSRSSTGGRGARILFDPVFSDRCSPTQWIGPKRFTSPPCKIEEIPEVDAIVISHNHYDHLDTHTIKLLSQRPRTPHFFAPLGNGYFFKSLGIPDSNIHIMDWWDSKRLEVPTSSDESDKANCVTVDMTCTPAQHFTGRTPFDRLKSLWASWVVEEITPSSEHMGGGPSSVSDSKGAKVFFGGDTGYRAVLDGQNEDEVPVCPAFKEIGERFDGFNFAMIPIGAYMPRHYMSPIHCAPQDSVRLFKDIQAKRALGMHWGTWVLTTEDVVEPPKKLEHECKKLGIEAGAFGVCEIGETMFF
ncbi:N-acyl-phosphatidylethanolamine-hydrolyzing phospholipase D [Hypsizygus marmoreus]|uniref:N-acyl-phosphatidylethanolamine-hydrolyzing phospholipase D n=1 Tax=Hypsizygus marmoreus TaxID=39966 RepID=A0A369JKK1_HYPMA|nr:N-acyl-phosphatidylethanolamine-hydrolyzing phospholipase D [Hypsizygus marmoreus]